MKRQFQGEGVICSANHEVRGGGTERRTRLLCLDDGYMWGGCVGR